MPTGHASQDDLPERLFTVATAARMLGLPVWKLQRAVRSGALPSYSIYNGRRLVRISEVVAAIDHSRQGSCT